MRFLPRLAEATEGLIRVICFEYHLFKTTIQGSWVTVCIMTVTFVAFVHNTHIFFNLNYHKKGQNSVIKGIGLKANIIAKDCMTLTKKAQPKKSKCGNLTLL